MSAMHVGLDHRTRQLAEAQGANFFGVADLSPARSAILAQGGPVIASFPRAISVGIALLHPVVDQLPRHTERAVAMSYKHHCYDVVNQRLDHITYRLSGTLQLEGHKAWPVPASQTVDDDRLLGVFSNKMAAHLAGLGWIGKSCLLVTPEVGPRVRWATVLTDAPLSATGGPTSERCGECQECVNVCPAHAFTGQPFHASERREARFAVHKCHTYFDQMKETTGVPVCGMCLYVCPYGKNGPVHQSPA